MSNEQQLSLSQAINNMIGAAQNEINVCIPALVTSYDAASEICAVQITTLIDDESESGQACPIIPGVPVVFPGARWMLSVGTSGLLISCDRDFSTWWNSGEISLPTTLGNHELGNSFFLPGVSRTVANAVPDGSSTVLDARVGGGAAKLLLHSFDADKSVVHEDIKPLINDFIGALTTWGAAVDALTAAPPGSRFADLVIPSVLALQFGLYLSNRVKVPVG
jgi:hypothetical protein